MRRAFRGNLRGRLALRISNRFGRLIARKRDAREHELPVWSTTVVGGACLLILCLALFGLNGCDGGMATVDPPTLQIDDGPPELPVHSVIGELSDVWVDCGSSSKDTYCRVEEEPPAAAQQPSTTPPPAAAPGTIETKWQVKSHYTLDDYKVRFRIDFNQLSGPIYKARAFSLSLPYAYNPNGSYTFTLPDLNRITVTPPTGAGPTAVPQILFGNLLGKSGAPGSKPKDFKITQQLDGSYNFTAGFGSLTLNRQPNGSYVGPLGSKYQQAWFNKGQWWMRVGGSGVYEITPTFSSTGLSEDDREDIGSALDYLDECDYYAYYGYWDLYAKYCSHSGEVSALKFLQDMRAKGWVPNPWTAEWLSELSSDVRLEGNYATAWQAYRDTSFFYFDKLGPSSTGQNWQAPLQTRPFGASTFGFLSPVLNPSPFVPSQFVKTRQTQDNWNYLLGGSQFKQGYNWNYRHSPSTSIPGIENINGNWPSASGSGKPPLDFRQYDTFQYGGDDWKIGLGLTWSYLANPTNQFSQPTSKQPITNALDSWNPSYTTNSGRNFRTGFFPNTGYTRHGALVYQPPNSRVGAYGNSGLIRLPYIRGLDGQWYIVGPFGGGAPAGPPPGVPSFPLVAFPSSFAAPGTTGNSAVLDVQIAVTVGPGGTITTQVLNDTVTLNNFSWNLNPIPSFLTGLASSLQRGLFSTGAPYLGFGSTAGGSYGNSALGGNLSWSFTPGFAYKPYLGFGSTAGGSYSNIALGGSAIPNVAINNGPPSTGTFVLSPALQLTLAGYKVLTPQQFLEQLAETARKSKGASGGAELNKPSRLLDSDELVLRLDGYGRAVLARGPRELATLNAGPLFGVESGTAWMAAPDLPQISYAVVANGNSSGEAFELQVLDTSGQFQRVEMPDGIVLQPAARKAPPLKAAGQAGNVLTQQVTAFCLQFANLPPMPGMLYKIAEPALQQQFRAIGKILEAGYELGANGELNPDMDLKEYTDAIRQYAAWAEIEGWNEQQFTEHWIERTKKNAQAMNIAWSQQMDNALRAAAPNRWRDIIKVRNKAKSLMDSSPAL